MQVAESLQLIVQKFLELEKLPAPDQVIQNARRNAMESALPAGEVWRTVPLWLAAGIISQIQGGVKVTSANHLITLCGMEPRMYLTPREINIIMRALSRIRTDFYVAPETIVPAETIRRLGLVISRFPGPFGQKDRLWKDVLRWATRDTYNPFLRNICLQFGEEVATDVQSIYRRIYIDTLGTPALSELSPEAKQERAKAAAVRSFLSALYYGMN